MSAKSYSLAGLWKARLADGITWEMMLSGSLDENAMPDDALPRRVGLFAGFEVPPWL